MDFSDLETAGARWPCVDVGARLLTACDAEDIFAEWRLLPSEEIAAGRLSTVILDPDGVLGMVGDRVPSHAGQGHSGWDSFAPSESWWETHGEGNEQCGTQVGAVAAHAHSARQRARVPPGVKASDSGAVGSWDKWYQGDWFGAPLGTRRHNGSCRIL